MNETKDWKKILLSLEKVNLIFLDADDFELDH